MSKEGLARLRLGGVSDGIDRRGGERHVADRRAVATHGASEDGGAKPGALWDRGIGNENVLTDRATGADGRYEAPPFAPRRRMVRPVRTARTSAASLQEVVEDMSATRMSKMSPERR